jgi:sarcosine oxidase subunit alpha
VVDSGKGGTAGAVDRLIVCGGWQPDLTLWHVAGGGSRWSPEHHRLEAVGAIEGIAIAGSAAGWTTRRGAIQSGADALDLLLGRPRRPVDELKIDPIYESPDGPCPVAEATDGGETYLDSDAQLLRRPRRSSRGWLNLLHPARRREGITALSEAPQPLTISEVAAAVDLELFPKDAAGVVAQERVALVPLANAAETAEAEPVPVADEEIPGFLAGRYADAIVQRIETTEQRRLEPGTLIYRSADVSQPLMAIGVVLRQVNAVTYALMTGPALPAATVVSVRDHGRAVPATIAAAPQP